MVDSFLDRTKIGRNLAKGVAMARRRDPSSPRFLDRIVRTDFYFDGESRPFVNEKRGDKFPPSLGTAWIPNPTRSIRQELQPRNPELLHLHELPLSERMRPEVMIEAIALNLSPTQDTLLHLLSARREFPAARALLRQRIVIEKSPPIAQILSSILHSATSTSLGVLIGTGLSPDPLIMSIAIPAGILLMGPIMGISKGLERGLARLIEEKIAPNRKRRGARRKKKAQKSRLK